MSDDDVVELAQLLALNSIVETLNLSGKSSKKNGVGERGGCALGETLRNNSTLTTLNLRLNSITGSGGVAIAEALKINSTLVVLDLAKNELGETEGMAIGNALPGMCNGLVVALGLLVLTNSCTPLLVKSMEIYTRPTAKESSPRFSATRPPLSMRRDSYHEMKLNLGYT